MRIVLCWVCACACGRIGFDPIARGDGGDPPGIELIQQRGTVVFDTSPLTIELPSPTRVGDVLVLCGASFDVDLTAVSGGGATWTRAIRDGATDNVEIWYGTITTPAQTVSVDGVGTTRSLWASASEWSGVRDAGLDGTATASGLTTADAAVSITTSGGAVELSYGCIVDSTATMYGAPAPGAWSTLDPIGDGNIAQLEFYRLDSAPAAYTVTIAQDGAYWDAATASFFAAP